MNNDIEYSDKYEDDVYEYRHVTLPREWAKRLPRPLRLMSENEWRSLGVQQSRGWVHYEIHKPEPHILLFRRPLGTDPRTGKVPGKDQPNATSSSSSSSSAAHALDAAAVAAVQHAAVTQAAQQAVSSRAQ